MKPIVYILLFVTALFLQSCTEPYALQTDTYESALVIEASLTDEFKFQEIKLSRTYKLEEDGPNPETNAIVYITDSNGNQYNFTGNGDKYISQEEFQALPNISYQLHVATADGKTYTSTNEKINSLTDIDDVEAVRGVNSKGEDGVQILVKSTRASNATEYYRFSYTETYKVIAPQWTPQRGTVVPIVPTPQEYPIANLVMEPWPYEAQICYSTKDSEEIALANTSLNTSTANVDLARFLNVTDYKIANRYSINVTMHNESLAAYNYYDALRKSSSDENLLSQNQPGFYSGNIKNLTNPNEKIIGFFSVSHVTSKRIFFNFEDIFQNHPKPEYPYNCPLVTDENENEFKFMYCFCYGSPACPTDPSCAGLYILESVRIRRKAVYNYVTGFVYLVDIQCGDCTSFSSNVRPSFWID
ncbi:MAG TPA: DUF4249 domain-containing protein [Flavobacterium sp.]|nr:DUF4249 domain-containing protein [Flavobacterium sp.]